MKSLVLISTFIILLSISCLIKCASGVNIVDIDATKTFVWGPGLDPENVTLRARYIFLQLVTKDGLNVTESPGKKIVSSQISGETSKGVPCQIWTQIFDCKDGSFIIRYRVYNSCFNVNISISVQYTVLSLEHSKFTGPVYAEECNCPNASLDLWLDNNKCNKNNAQMDLDLKKFSSINFDTIRDEIIAVYDKPNSVSICHYVIKSNNIYRKCYGKHVDFKMFVDSILLSLTRKSNLPDVEFFTNLGDWPLVPKTGKIYPIFSWCGSEDFYDIVLPTYDITKSSIETMGGVMLDMISVQGNTKLKWDKKIKKVFWRGRDARRERLDLIDIARKNPSLFNASITNFFFFTNEIDKYGPKEKYISFFDFFDYKFQLNIDGTVAAYRFPYLLGGDSLVFKQDSKYYEFFYKDLNAGTQFVPIKSDLSDLVKKVEWALNNDDEAYKITKEARKYVRDNLMPRDIFCYHMTLIKEWSKRLVSKVNVFPDMTLVPQPHSDCECILSNNRRKKDEF